MSGKWTWARRALCIVSLSMTINVVLGGIKASADLFSPSVLIDIPSVFLGSVDYMGPLTPDIIRFKPVTVDPLIMTDFITVNWIITVKQERVDIPAPAAANDIEVLAIHQVPPHGEGVGGLVETPDFLNVDPGDTRGIQSFSRLHDSHRDVLQARIDFIGAGISRISIRADHLVAGDPPPVPVVPEPATLLLLGSGLAGLAGLRKKRRPCQS